MKVICTGNDWFKEVPNVSPIEEKNVPNLPNIPIGAICTVIDEAGYSGMNFYRFSEYLHPTNDYKWWYDQSAFIDIEQISSVAVNTFYTTSYKELSDLVLPNLVSYCKSHNYDLFINKIGKENPHFVKTEDARKLLDSYELVMSIEIDALIINPDISIESFIDKDHDIFLTKDVNGSNSGVVIWKSTEFTKKWLDFIQSKKEYYGDEQNVFENFNDNKIKYCPHPAFNSVPYDLYYKPSYGKIGYIEGEEVKVPTHNQGNFKKGDFIFHLPGKTLEERIKIFTELKDKIIYE